MREFLKMFVFLLAFIIFLPIASANEDLAQKMSGNILLQVESNGEAWYVYPDNNQRYYLGRPTDAFEAMRSLGIGITNANLDKIPVALSNIAGKDSDSDGLSDNFEDAIGTNKNNIDTDGDTFNDKDELEGGYSPLAKNKKLNYDLVFANQQKGKIFIQVESNGEAWYINPQDAKRYYLGRPDDAFNLMRGLGIGITNTNLETINVAQTSAPVLYTLNFQADAANTGVYNVKALRDPKGIQWEREIETVNGISGAVYYDDTIYIAEGIFSSFISAYDVETGKQKWSFELEGSVMTYPVVNNKFVYIGTDDGYLYAINRLNGRVIWENQLEDSYFSSMVVYADYLIWSSESGNVMVFNAKNGNLLWEQEIDINIYATPAIGNNLIYFVDSDSDFEMLENGKCIALSLITGEEIWSTGTDTDFFAAPILGEDALYLMSVGNTLYSLNPLTGKENWKREQPGMSLASGVLYNDLLVYSSFNEDFMVSDLEDFDSVVVAYSTVDGSIVWEKEHTGVSMLPLVAAENVLYLVTFGEKVVYGINIENGEEIFKIDIPVDFGILSLADDKILIRDLGDDYFGVLSSSDQAEPIVVIDEDIKDVRDAKRVSDVRQVSVALELYFNDNNSYPPSDDEGYILGEDYVKLSEYLGFSNTGDGVVYMGAVPSDPLSDNFWEYRYNAYSEEYDSNFCKTEPCYWYEIVFELEGTSTGLEGLLLMTPTGIKPYYGYGDDWAYHTDDYEVPSLAYYDDDIYWDDSLDYQRMQDIELIGNGLVNYFSVFNSFPVSPAEGLVLGQANSRVLSAYNSFASTPSGDVYILSVPADPVSSGNYEYRYFSMNRIDSPEVCTIAPCPYYRLEFYLVGASVYYEGSKIWMQTEDEFVFADAEGYWDSEWEYAWNDSNYSDEYYGDDFLPLVDDHVMGDLNAPITIIEYSDFECPFCKRYFDQTYWEIYENYILSGDVNYVYRHYPLSFHTKAEKAAIVAECAGEQDYFWEMRDLLFDNQTVLGDDLYIELATDLGLDLDEFKFCLIDVDPVVAVAQDINRGDVDGVNGTPSFFINGYPLSGAQPYSEFKKVIEAILNDEPLDYPQNNYPEVVVTDTDYPNNDYQDIDIYLNEPMLGDPDAPVTIIEYSDFECPFCGRFTSDTFPALKVQYIDTGKVRMVFRQFPLSFHNNARVAAAASLCAYEQDSFWEMHDVLYANNEHLDRGSLIRYANQLNLDTEEFIVCLDSDVTDTLIDYDIEEGTEYGVTGTPAFFINGRKLAGAQPLAAFQEIIDEELAK